MSHNYKGKEEAINQLYNTIRAKFESDGVLQDVRCMLQSKMVSMMKGKNETTPLVERTAHVHNTLHHLDVDSIDNTSSCYSGSVRTNSPESGRSSSDTIGDRDARIQVLHQLIMEYFHWHGYQYTAEMFAMESLSENAPPVRECLEGVLGDFQFKSVPILLEIVADLMKKNK